MFPKFLTKFRLARLFDQKHGRGGGKKGGGFENGCLDPPHRKNEKHSFRNLT